MAERDTVTLLPRAERREAHICESFGKESLQTATAATHAEKIKWLIKHMAGVVRQ